MWTEMFEDVMQTRIAATNRIGRGDVDPIAYEPYVEALVRSEKICALQMRRCYRRVVPPEIIAWQRTTSGVGEHLLARLLGQLGHPILATPHHWEGTGSTRVLIADTPRSRTLAQLRQYCGHGAPGQRRRGASASDIAALGSPKLKMILHLIAESCMKNRSSPFRLVYEKEREAVEVRLHTVTCARCGPSGRPAQPGTPWSRGHQHAHALRVTGKEILRDLFIVAGGPRYIR